MCLLIFLSIRIFLVDLLGFVDLNVEKCVETLSKNLKFQASEFFASRLNAEIGPIKSTV